jgi:hypothetical protein
MPEVVEHGVSGFIVGDESEAIATLSRIGRLDRHQVRQAFERRFLTRRIPDDYLRIYRKLLNRAQGGLAPASATLQERLTSTLNTSRIADSRLAVVSPTANLGTFLRAGCYA